MKKKIINFLMTVIISFLIFFTIIEWIMWLIKSISSSNVYNTHMLLFLVGLFGNGLLIALDKKVKQKIKS